MRFKTRQQRQAGTCSFEEEYGFAGKKHFKGGGGGGSSVSQTMLDPVQRKALESIIAKSEAAYNRGPLQFFPGSTLADESANTLAGRENLLLGAGIAGALGLTGSDAFMNALNVDLVNDPRTAAVADAATAPIYDQFYGQVLPGISSAATSAGAFGGDRANVLKSDATRELGRAVGETRAGIFNEAFRANLDNQARLFGLLPSMQTSALLPGQVMTDVGNQETARRQQEIDAERERFEFNQYEPEAMIDRFASRVAGLNFGGTSISKTKQSGGGLFGK